MTNMTDLNTKFLSYSNYSAQIILSLIIAALRKITRDLLIAVSRGFIFLSFYFFVAFDSIVSTNSLLL